MKRRRRAGFVLLALLLTACGSLLDYPSPHAEVCNNGIDDDYDGKIDCQDPDCDGKCKEQGQLCFDGRDNDGDGLVDARDPGCWRTRDDVTFERCATVSGTKKPHYIGPVFGKDWYLMLPDGTEPNEAIVDGKTPILWGGSPLLSNFVATGSFGGTVVTARLYDNASGGMLPLAGGQIQTLQLNSVGGGPPLFVAEKWVNGQNVVSVQNVDVLQFDETTHPAFVDVKLTIDPGGLTGTVAVNDGEPAEFGMPTGWKATTPFRLSWQDLTVISAPGAQTPMAGIVSASVYRPDYFRCGGPAPDGSTGTVRPSALTLLPDGSACVAMENGKMWTLSAKNGVVNAGVHDAKWAPEGMRIGALAWDPDAQLLRAVAQQGCQADTSCDAGLRACCGTLQGCQPENWCTGAPRLVSAPACAGPWHDDGAMLAQDVPVTTPIGYGIVGTGPLGERHQILLAFPAVDSSDVISYTFKLASSPDGAPQSFTLTSGILPPQPVLPAVARLGNDWMQLAADDDGSLALDLLGGHSPIATLTSSVELGSYDGLGYGAPLMLALRGSKPEEGVALASAAVQFELGDPPYTPDDFYKPWGPLRIHVTPK